MRQVFCCPLLVALLAAPALTAATLRFEVRDEATDRPLACRFSLGVNGIDWFPERVGSRGVRFISLHESKQQLFVATYATDKGPIEVVLPASAEKVEVRLTRGFDYVPLRRELVVAELDRPKTFKLRRWAGLADVGWRAADAHLHYDRHSRRADPLWFAMMAGDGLDSAHFMYLIGGKVPGEWAVQYGYGLKGEAHDRGRLISAGLEYRDTMQGHVNLLGMPEIVPPVMAGRAGLPNYPTVSSVLRRTREKGGLPVVAHGGSLGSQATVILDGILGSPDAIEIGNSHLYSLDNWYALLNAGYIYPPVAGTDLPNYPERDWWQPFLGGMRTYARVDGTNTFAAWKAAVRAGRVFVSSGLIPRFTVNGEAGGSHVRLARPGLVDVAAELASPLGVQELEVIRDGAPLALEGVQRIENDGVTRMQWNGRVMITNSCWLALRGRGAPIRALKRAQLPPTPWHCSDVVAHTSVVRVTVGGQPIGSAAARAELVNRLRELSIEYAAKARYENDTQRREMQALFDQAQEILKGR